MNNRLKILLIVAITFLLANCKSTQAPPPPPSAPSSSGSPSSPSSASPGRPSTPSASTGSSGRKQRPPSPSSKGQQTGSASSSGSPSASQSQGASSGQQGQQAGSSGQHGQQGSNDGESGDGDASQQGSSGEQSNDDTTSGQTSQQQSDDIDFSEEEAGGGSAGGQSSEGGQSSQGGQSSGEPAMTSAERAGQLNDQLDQAMSDYDDMILKDREYAQNKADEQGSQNQVDAYADAGPLYDDVLNGGAQTSQQTGTSAQSGTGTIAAPAQGNKDGDYKHTRQVYAPPSDIPSGNDDDVVARQIREAALTESDPKLREKLWQEYRRYKQNE